MDHAREPPTILIKTLSHGIRLSIASPLQEVWRADLLREHLK